MRDLSVLFVFLLLSACGASAAPVAEGDAQVGNLDASGDDRGFFRKQSESHFSGIAAAVLRKGGIARNLMVI